jgi:hypothetical protein
MVVPPAFAGAGSLARLVERLRPLYPKGERGRPPIGLERMLRLYLRRQGSHLGQKLVAPRLLLFAGVFRLRKAPNRHILSHAAAANPAYFSVSLTGDGPPPPSSRFWTYQADRLNSKSQS